jgi:cytochrome c553
MCARDRSALARAFAAGGLALCAFTAAAADASATQGQQIATHGTSTGVPACITCHGARGEGTGGMPRLAGAGTTYLREQLDAFAAGTRQNPVMQPFAQKLSASERAAVAAYFARLPAPVVAKDVDATPAQAGAWLATRGRWSDGIPACAQCHGPGGVGVGETFPPLAGQPAAYIAAQIEAEQAGTRPSGPLALMQTIARKMNAADITAVSAYYAGLATASNGPAAREQRQ